MRRKNGVYWIAAYLAFTLVLGGITLAIDSEVNDLRSTEAPLEAERGPIGLAGTPHAPILINHDDNFTQQGWPGSGTPEDPYVIEGLDIDLGGAPGDCISISNTRVNFTIRNCYLTGAAINEGSGVFLDNVSYGLVLNNTISSNLQGIIISWSSSIIITNNTVTSNSNTGIALIRSISNTIVNNTYANNQFGIYLLLSDSNTLSDNTCTSNTDTGIYLDTASNLNDIQWNVFVNNPRNGYDRETGNVFDHNYWSDYVGTDANQDGFGDTPYTFTGNSDPHPLVNVPIPLTWTQSPVDQVLEFGFLIICDLNATTHLPLMWYLNNSLFSIDNEGVVTSWFPLPIGIYGLEVVGTNIRGHNLTASFRVIVQDTIAPHWIIEPSDQVLQHGEGLDYQLPVADLSGIDHWTFNDTSHFALTVTFYHQGSTARLVNATVLEPGIYPLSVTVFDRFGNSISTVFSITVLETTMTTTEGEGGIDPTLTFVLGIGVGGAVVILIVLAVLRRRGGE